MNHSKSVELRRVLDLPAPRAMSKADRKFWRQIKRKYAKLPAPARSSFLDNVSVAKSLIQS